MKKVKWFLPLLIALALILAACDTSEQDGTPGVTPEATEGDIIVVPTADATNDLTETDTAPGDTPEASGGAPSNLNLVDPSLASNIIGADIAGANGDEIGNVDSLVFDPNTGDIGYLLVDVNDGILEEQGLTAIPWQAFRVSDVSNDEEDLFAFDLNPDILVNAPVMQAEDTTVFSDPTWDDNFVTFWGDTTSIPQTGASDARMIRLSDATDLQLVDSNHEDIGDIEDFILDTNAGSVQYAVWAAGGFLDVGERLIPVPLSHLAYVDEEDGGNNFLLDIDRDSLNNAPYFANMDEIPDVSVSGWDAEINQFWNSIQSQ